MSTFFQEISKKIQEKRNNPAIESPAQNDEPQETTPTTSTEKKPETTQ